MEDHRDPDTYAIIGAAMAVHSELGNGFLERVYHEALAIELTEREIPFEQEKSIEVKYKGQLLKCGYNADFICYENVIVEMKALDALSDAHRAQTINYLKATSITRALLINFGAKRLEYERLVLNHP